MAGRPRGSGLAPNGPACLAVGRLVSPRESRASQSRQAPREEAQEPSSGIAERGTSTLRTRPVASVHVTEVLGQQRLRWRRGGLERGKGGGVTCGEGLPCRVAEVEAERGVEGAERGSQRGYSGALREHGWREHADGVPTCSSSSEACMRSSTPTHR